MEVSTRALFGFLLMTGLVTQTHHVMAVPEIYYVQDDHLGTPQMLHDENGIVVWRADYAPFGQVNIDDDPDLDGRSIDLPIRFPGQYADSESGLHYNYFRDYDPGVGRYNQSDPIGLRGGLNTYGYAYQDPLRHADPDGRQPVCFLWPWGTVVCAVAAVGAAASIKQCSDGIDDLQEGFDNAEKYRSEQKQAIDCLMDPSCHASTAQQHTDNAQQAAQRAYLNAASAAQNIGTSVPGTTATGPIPTSVGDMAAGAVLNAAASQ